MDNSVESLYLDLGNTKQGEYAIDLKDVFKSYTLVDQKPSWRKLIDVTLRKKCSTNSNLINVLCGISFQIKKGQSLGIVGLNGSGKSTLLQIITRTVRADSGKVKTNGRVAALLELGSGFNPEFTGRENVFLNAALFGLSEKETRDRLPLIESFANIGSFIDQPVKTYSSGMSLRLAFSVVANVNPDILIIDEALAVGDAIFIQKCMRYLREFKKLGTLVLVSHDLTAIKSLSDHCIWLHRGKIRLQGSSKIVSDEYLSHILCHENEVQTDKQAQPVEKSGKKNPEETAFLDSEMVLGNQRCLNLNPESTEFGSKKAIISNLEFVHSESNCAISCIEGLESVTLKISASCISEVRNPIVGFFIRDRLGQDLFGDNSWNEYKNTDLVVPKDGKLKARFCFQMPRLPSGDYSLTVAVAEGDEKSHKILHWLNDAIILHAIGTAPPGLIGIPMQTVELKLAS